MLNAMSLPQGGSRSTIPTGTDQSPLCQPLPTASQPPPATFAQPVLPPPDVLVQLGGQQFHAHRAVLAGHSGYFRAVFWASDNHAVPSEHAANKANGPDHVQPALTVVVPPFPTLAAKTFTTILDFLYTSHLYLDVNNVSEVSAAAQQLGVPQAVDACRNFLLHLRHLWYHQQQQQQLPAYTASASTTALSSIRPPHHQPLIQQYLNAADLDDHTFPTPTRPRLVRPIPNRQSTATFLPHYLQQGFWQHPYAESGKPVATPPVVSVATEPTPASPITTICDSRCQSTSRTSSYSPSSASQWDMPTSFGGSGCCETSRSPAPDTVRLQPSSPDLDPGVDSIHFPNPPHGLQQDEEANPSAKPTEQHCDATVPTPLAATSGQTGPGAASKVVIDVACCDGPVKFQRVLNENSSLVLAMEDWVVDRPGCAAREEATRPACTATNESLVGQANQRRSRQLLQKRWQGHMRQMNAECDPTANTRPANDSGKQSQAAPQADCGLSNEEPPAADRPTATTRNNSKSSTTKPVEGRVYHCVYCQHTFKSRYCYVKHKRRHLNPLTVDGESATTKERNEEDNGRSGQATPVIQQNSVASRQVTASTTETTGAVAAASSKRPLEINVPFYPCKMCGGKFPSYYFVHKHRRTCRKRLERETSDKNASTSSNDEDSVCPTMYDNKNQEAMHTDRE